MLILGGKYEYSVYISPYNKRLGIKIRCVNLLLTQKLIFYILSSDLERIVSYSMKANIIGIWKNPLNQR